MNTYRIYSAATEKPASDELVAKAIEINQDNLGPGAHFFVDNEGRAHRDNDFPAIIYPNGDLVWMKHGLRHRDDGKFACTLDPQRFTDGRLVR